MQIYGLNQKLLAILVFCLFKRNCRLLSNPTGDTADEKKYESVSKNLKNFQFFLRNIWRDIYYLLAVVSPVGFNNNRQFLLKRQKTRIANNFWFRPNIWMKLSGCMRKYIVYDISLIFLMRQLFDKEVKYTNTHGVRQIHFLRGSVYQSFSHLS